MEPTESESGRERGSGPDRPLLVFDGDCGFCRFWIARWRSATGDRVRFAPSQEVAGQFPQIPPEKFAEAVQLILPDGALFGGAEAVFRTLAYAPGRAPMLWMYRRVPGFAPASEAAYRLVAAHRPLFSKLTSLLWGRQGQPSSYLLSRWLFLRLLGVVYFVAFLSLSTQVTGLIGARGILPAHDLLQEVASRFGAERFHLLPTLAWFGASDTFLKFLAEGGTILALLVICGVAVGPVLVILWAFYLSLVVVGRDFLSFQWDVLLLEAGFLAIFFAPWRLLAPAWSKSRAPRPPSRTVLWLLRWLLFRLLFLSGAVKLLSHDLAWRDLTALDYHYWTQPLPTPVAWYAAQLPEGLQKLSVVGVFVLELAVPFLIFFPRRARFVGAALICGFQALIGLTGNYCFFNLLTVTLAVLLLDDSALRRLFPTWLRERICGTEPGPRPRWRLLATAPLTAVILFLSTGRMLERFGAGGWLPDTAQSAIAWFDPFYLANNYGLFAVMTTSRVEIQVEGSNDGQNWLAYDFKYKPGDVHRAPRWVEPMQPRLDWQMWFAALGGYRESPWFVDFMARLLQGSPGVLALLETNPFPAAPPRYIRAVAYDYHFTNFAERRASGAWWRRELKGLYFPAVSLRRP